MLKLEGFQYGTSLEFNMGYNHVELIPFSKWPCTIVLPWANVNINAFPWKFAIVQTFFKKQWERLWQTWNLSVPTLMILSSSIKILGTSPWPTLHCLYMFTGCWPQLVPKISLWLYWIRIFGQLDYLQWYSDLPKNSKHLKLNSQQKNNFAISLALSIIIATCAVGHSDLLLVSPWTN